MKMDLAIYTAQEGYAWQPGTALTTDELVRFKKSIGKFPSSDSTEFPYGGIFLLEDRVVFYRYHVAKKIDFRGRDALYCVLGAVSREEAAKIDPAALFACPEFAGPMKPFPVSLDVPEADPATVPEWLKNLDKMTLDVRITGPAENPNYAVEHNPIELPQPAVAPTPAPNGSAASPQTAAMQGPAESIPVPDGGASSPSAPQYNASDSPTPVSNGRGTRLARLQPKWIFVLAASLALLALIGVTTAITLGIMARKRNGQASVGYGTASTNVASVAITALPTNTVDVATNKVSDVTNTASAATLVTVTATNVATPATNVATPATNVATLATNMATKATNEVTTVQPVQKSVPAVKPPVQKPVQAVSVAKPKPTPTASAAKPQTPAAKSQAVNAKRPAPVVQKGNSSSKKNGAANR